MDNAIDSLPSRPQQIARSPSLWNRLLARIGGGRTPAALFDQGLVSGANFLTNVLLARAFGLRDYGVFALAWLAVLFANSLQYALIVTPMISVGPKQEERDRPSYYGAVLIQGIGFALFAALVMFVSVRLSTRYFPQWRVGFLALPISGATMAYLLQELLRRYFFCVGKSKMALITDVVSYICQVPIIFWVAHTRTATLTNALWIIAATSLVAFLSCVPWFEHVTFSAQAFRSVFLRHWRISRWLAPTAFMQWGAGNLFLLSAPAYYGAAASAALRAANNIVGVSHLWILGLDNVIPAEASRRMSRLGVEEMLRYLRSMFLRWGGVTLAFSTIIIAFPTFWLQLSYGGKYSSDAPVLRLYAVLYLIIFTAGPLRAGLWALEYTKPIFWAYPLMIAFSVALAGPLARGLGLNGVIIGMCAVQLISQGFVGTALWIRVKKMRREAGSDALKPPET